MYFMWIIHNLKVMNRTVFWAGRFIKYSNLEYQPVNDIQQVHLQDQLFLKYVYTRKNSNEYQSSFKELK